MRIIIEAAHKAGITGRIVLAQIFLCQGYFFRNDVLLERGSGFLLKKAVDIGCIMVDMFGDALQGYILRKMTVDILKGICHQL